MDNRIFDIALIFLVSNGKCISFTYFFVVIVFFLPHFCLLLASFDKQEKDTTSFKMEEICHYNLYICAYPLMSFCN